MAFNLPVPEGDPGVSFTSAGLQYQGKIIPYQGVKKFKATSDDELEITLWEKEDGDDKVLTFQIEDGCSHQLLDLQTFVETAILQQGVAVMEEPMRERIAGIRNPETGATDPMPLFDMKKVRRSFASAYNFGR